MQHRRRTQWISTRRTKITMKWTRWADDGDWGNGTGQYVSLLSGTLVHGRTETSFLMWRGSALVATVGCGNPVATTRRERVLKGTSRGLTF